MLTGQPERRFWMDFVATKALYIFHLQIAIYLCLHYRPACSARL